MIGVVASHSAWLDLANAPAQWPIAEAQVRKIVGGLTGGTPSVHWTTEELRTFIGDVPRRSGQAELEAMIVVGTFAWRLPSGLEVRSPCMVGRARLSPAADGGWSCVLLGSMTANHALRTALLATQPNEAMEDASATLGDLFPGDADSARALVGTFTAAVTLCQLGPAVDNLLTELLGTEGPLRALTRTQQFTLRGTPPELLFPLDADAAQRDVVASVVRGDSVCVDALSGTGTTQTVANALVNVAAAGKTAVLIFDDDARMASVLARLESVGLGQCAMAVTAQTTGLDVATRLAQQLRGSWRPANGAQGDDQLLARVDDYLARHWDALLQTLPHGTSMFDALCTASDNGSPVADIAGDLEGLSAAEMAMRREAVVRYAAAAAALAPHGSVAQHPWLQSNLRSWDLSDAALPGECARALQALLDASTKLDGLVHTMNDLVPGFDLASVAAIGRVAQLCDVAATAPGLGAEALVAARTLELETPRNPAMRAQQSFATPTTVAEYVELALLHRELVALAEAAFLPAIESVDLQTTIENLQRAADGAAAMRYLRMRAPRAQLAPLSRSELPTDDAELIRSVEVAYAARRSGLALGKAANLASRWFGSLFVNGALDVPGTVAALQWAGTLRKTFDACGIVEGNRERMWRALVAQVATLEPRPLAALSELREAVDAWSNAVADVRRLFAFDSDVVSTDRFAALALRAQLQGWQAALPALPDWVAYRHAREGAHAVGLGALVFQFESQTLAADALFSTWERSLNEAVLRHAFANNQALRDFDGATMERAIADFARLDQSALAVAKARVLSRLAELRPMVTPRVANRDVDGIDAEIADLLALVASRNHDQLSVADILTRFGGLWPLLTPCLLIAAAHTPAVVAPSTIFDVALVLGAEQLPNAWAYPALARANAIVAFGSAKLAATDSLWQHLCARSGALPVITLGTRYMTMQPSLLPEGARAGTVPVARPHNAVTWRVSQASDASAEAAEVAALVAAHQADDLTRTYCVVVPTAAHRIALAQLGLPLTIVDIRSATLPSADVVVVCSGNWGTDRDYTTRYTAEQWRLLAGAAASEQIVVIGPDTAIDAAVMVTAWQQVSLNLRQQAQCGELVQAYGGHTLAQQLATQLEARGWTVKLGVGDGAALIDVAVVDPNDASSFVLAVEFDSGRNAQTSVRSRARIWPNLLAQRGWRHIRVWALDWLHDANREAARVHGAVIAAIAAKRSQRRRPSVSPAPAARATAAQLLATSPQSSPVLAPAPLLAADTARTELAVGSAPLRIPSEITVRTQAAIRIAIAPYAVAYVPAGRRSPNDLFAPKHVAELQKIIEQVLAAEAPMHISLLTRRVAMYFGVAKPTSEIAARVAEVGQDMFAACWEPNVVWRRDQKHHDLPSVRVAASNPQTRRDVTQVPLMEIAAAIRVVTERAQGIAAADLVRESAKLLGFARFTADVKSRIERGLEVATFANAVAMVDGRVQLP